MGLMAVSAAMISSIWIGSGSPVKGREWMLPGAILSWVIIQPLFIDINDHAQLVINNVILISCLFLYLTVDVRRLFRLRMAIGLLIVANFYAAVTVVTHFGFMPDTVFSDTFHIWRSSDPTFQGPLYQSNVASLFLILSVLGAYIFISRKGLTAPLTIASILPIATALSTGSRAASGLIIAVSVSMILLSLRSKRSTLNLTIGVIASVALGGSLSCMWCMSGIDHGTVVDRMSLGFGAREVIMSGSWLAYMESPIFGLGPGGLASIFIDALHKAIEVNPSLLENSSAIAGGNEWAHNIFIQYLCDYGLPGGLFILILLVLLVIRFFKESFTKFDSRKSYAVMFAGIILMHGMVSVSLAQGFIMVLFAVSMSAVMRDQRVGPRGLMSMFFCIPMLLAVYFITMSSRVALVLDYDIHDKVYINEMIAGMTDPVIYRPTMMAYFEGLIDEGGLPEDWISSRTMAERYWLVEQSASSAMSVIVAAHMANDTERERQMINKMIFCFPESRKADTLRSHMLKFKETQ